jgi:hypothetical protein
MSNNNHVRKRLLEVYSPDETGTWRILGEDPNCDWGGSHHEPELETVTGTYRNVVEYALTLKNFYTWGGGGRIVKQPSRHLDVDTMPRNPKVAKLEAERTTLQQRLAEIEKELKEII